MDCTCAKAFTLTLPGPRYETPADRDQNGCSKSWGETGVNVDGARAVAAGENGARRVPRVSAWDQPRRRGDRGSCRPEASQAECVIRPAARVRGARVRAAAGTIILRGDDELLAGAARKTQENKPTRPIQTICGGSGRARRTNGQVLRRPNVETRLLVCPSAPSGTRQRRGPPDTAILDGRARSGAQPCVTGQLAAGGALRHVPPRTVAECAPGGTTCLCAR